jgi:hypothetical protein
MRNKNFQILEIGTFRSLLVKFILEIVKDRGNPSTYYWKLSTQYIQQQKTHFGILFFSCTSNQQNNINWGPSYEHSYQVWFQKRRLKCKSLWMTTSTMTVPMPTTDAKWWQYPTWPFRSVELITLQSCIWLTNDHFTKHAKNKNICIIQAI